MRRSIDNPRVGVPVRPPTISFTVCFIARSEAHGTDQRLHNVLSLTNKALSEVSLGSVIKELKICQNTHKLDFISRKQKLTREECLPCWARTGYSETFVIKRAKGKRCIQLSILILP